MVRACAARSDPAPPMITTRRNASQVYTYETDSDVVQGHDKPFGDYVARLQAQRVADNMGRPLPARRLVVFIFNGVNHYDAAVPTG